jgi:hypothetical protein
MLSALSELRVPARPRHAEYERSQRSLPVIDILQPALFSGLLRTEEVLVDLLPRRAHWRACVASGHVRHAANVLRGLCGRGFGSCRLVLRPCVSNDKDGCAGSHESKRFHVDFSQKPKSDRSANYWPKKAISGSSSLEHRTARIAWGHVATLLCRTPSTQDEEIVNALHLPAQRGWNWTRYRRVRVANDLQRCGTART